MERREKILAIVAGSLGIIFVCFYVYSSAMESIERAKNAVVNNRNNYNKAVKEKDRFDEMYAYVRNMEFISLPGDSNLAQIAYQPWLQDLANFRDPLVKPLGNRVLLAGQCRLLTFQLTGTGTLADLTDFLYEFNRYDLPHRISVLSASPVNSRTGSGDYNDQLQLSITVEAISMSNAVAEDVFMPELKEGYFTQQQYEQVVKEAILDRNLFDYNMAPTLNNIRDRIVQTDEDEISFRVSAIDPEGRPLSYRLENAPRGMSIDSRGEITFVPRDREEAAEYKDIVVIVEDIGMRPRQVSTTFSVQVAKAAPAPEAPPEIPFDATRYSYVTNIRDDGTGPTVVIDNRPQGEYHTLRLDESVEISGITFTIVAIDFESETVTISAEDIERVLKLGDNLSGFGTPLSTTIRPNFGGSRGRGGFGSGGFGNRGGSSNRSGFGNRGTRGRRGGDD